MKFLTLKNLSTKYLGCLIFVFVCSFSFAQQNNDPILHRSKLNALEFSQALKAEYDRLETARINDDLEGFFKSIIKRNYRLEDVEASSLQQFIQLSDSVLFRAMPLLKTAEDHKGFVRVGLSMGYFYQDFSLIDRAIFWYEAALRSSRISRNVKTNLKLIQLVFGSDEQEEIQSLWYDMFRPLSTLYNQNGNIEKSISYSIPTSVVNQYRSVLSSNLLVSINLHYSNLLHNKEAHEDAIDILQETVRLNTLSNKNGILVPISIASHFKAMNKFDSAFYYLSYAQSQLLDSIPAKQDWLANEVSIQFAYLFHDMALVEHGDSLRTSFLSNALSHYLDVDERIGSQENSDRYYIKLGLGQIHTILSNYDEGEAQLMEALSLIYGNKSVNVRQVLRKPLADRRLIYVLDDLSKIYQIRGENRENHKLLLEALKLKKAIWAVEDSVRGFYYEDQHRIRFNSSRESRREDMLNLLYKMWGKYKEADLVKTALNVFERSRAQELRASLRKKDVLSNSNIPQQLLQEITDIEQKIYNERLNDASERDQSNYTLEQYRTRYQILNDSLRALNPSYHQAVYGTKSMNLRKLHRSFSLDEVMLAYYWGERHVYRIVVSKKKTSFSRIPQNKEFKREVRQLLEFVKNPYPNAAQEEAYLVAGTSLHKKLIPEDLYRDYDELIIAPHDSLGLIPFGILLENRPDQLEAYDALDYLYSYYSSVRYTLSPGMAKKAKKDATSLKPFRYVGIAPAYVDLKFNVEEVNIVDSIFKEIGYQTKALFDQEASKEGFREYAEQGDILHLAMHAQEDVQTGEKSYLLFGDLDTLNLYELYGMSLQAKLAILSACNAAKGELQKGEGMISLARAFRFSGCENVVTSLWEVADYEASTMIPDFLLGIEGGYRPADALARAQSIFTSYPENSALPPYYWAQFVVYGENTAMGQPDLTWTKRILWGIFISVLLIALLYFGGQFQSLKRAS